MMQPMKKPITAEQIEADKQAADLIRALDSCAVIKLESGAYFKEFKGFDVERVNLLAQAAFYVIGSEVLRTVIRGLHFRGFGYQVVILGRVGALPEYRAKQSNKPTLSELSESLKGGDEWLPF